MRSRRGRGWVVPALVSLLALAGCSKSEAMAAGPAPTSTAAAAGPGTGDVSITVSGRPFQLHVPASYTQGTAVALIVLLHGYTSSGAGEESYLKFTAESDRRGFLYATPDGTAESGGNRFWNATDACCNFYGSTVDDSGYLSALITEVGKRYTVDSKRVYLVGHSNGAFMSYRFACDHADQITAIVSLAGAMWSDPSSCRPKRPVSILEVHGTADERIDYNGAEIVGNAYPSVATTLKDWRGFDGCAATATNAAAPLDLVSDLAGAETTVTTYSTGCRNSTRVEHWKIANGPHIPRFTSAFAAAATDFLLGQVAA